MRFEVRVSLLTFAGLAAAVNAKSARSAGMGLGGMGGEDLLGGSVRVFYRKIPIHFLIFYTYCYS